MKRTNIHPILGYSMSHDETGNNTPERVLKCGVLSTTELSTDYSVNPLAVREINNNYKSKTYY